MESHQKLIDLRPDRLLLNSDFDGYKLSLTEIPTITEQLKVSVDRLAPSANQYSLLHAKLYGLQNHLVGEIGDESVYFVDKDLKIQQFSIETVPNQLANTTVWQIPLQRPRIEGSYNVSMRLIPGQLAVVADGMGYLYLVDRGSRDINDQWKTVFSGEVAGPDQNFVIVDAVHKEAELHLLLLSVRQRESNERYVTVLHWITTVKTDKWNQAAIRELVVEGFVQYASLERSCVAVYVVSDAGCVFTLDSENEVRKSCRNEGINYTWTQTEEDVSVKFQLPHCVKDLINVESEPTTIRVTYNQNILLEGVLHSQIDPNSTCWTASSDCLEIVLQKCETKLWCELVQGDERGEYVEEAGREIEEEVTSAILIQASLLQLPPENIRSDDFIMKKVKFV